MTKELEWYEVFDCTTRATCDGRTDVDKVLLGRYSTEQKGTERLRTWAENKGIDYDDHMENHNYPTIGIPIEYDEVEDSIKNELTFEKITVVGMFFDINDEPTTFGGDWVYASYAILRREILELDKDT